MEDERNNKPMPAQWRHLLNSSHIQQKIDQSPKLRAIFDPGRKRDEILEELYLTVLSRFPTAEEVKTAEAYGTPVATYQTRREGRGGSRQGGAGMKRRDDWVDITWALINSNEFLYRH
jgi:hypothetical protein